MKYLKSFYQIILFFSLIISLISCKDDEIIPNLTIEGNDTEKVWEAKSLGDTITLNYTTNLSANKVKVNNPLSWVDYELTKNRLKLFVKANNDIAKRSGNISLIGVEKGTMLSNNIISLSQNSDKKMAQVKYLYTHFLKMKTSQFTEKNFHNENRVFKMILPEAGGEVNFEQIFVTNINPEDIEVVTEYNEDNSQDWIKKTEFIITENGIEGIKVEVEKLPENINQRSVKITLRDKGINEINASIVCSQFRELVKLASSENSIINIPARPMDFYVLLKTELNMDQIEFKMITARLTSYNFDNINQATFDARVADPIFKYNYIDDFGANTKEQENYYLEETSEGIVLKGQTTTNSYYSGTSTHYKDPYKKLIQITNKVNDQKLFITINQDNSIERYYIFFEDDTKEMNVAMPSEGGSFSLKKIKNNSNYSLLYMQYPEWSDRNKNNTSWSGGWQVKTDIYYPDILKMKEPITILPNTYRNERLGVFIVSFLDFTGNTSFTLPNTYNAKPLEIKLTQAGFTGTYTLEPISNIDEEIFIDSNQGGTPIGFNTNLSKDQIDISKTAESGWIDYQIKTDSQTGYVTSILFMVDQNTTDANRTSTLTIKGPEGEGLQEINVKFTQSK